MKLPKWREEPLSKAHDRKSFDCGDIQINDFLLRYAREFLFMGGLMKEVASYDAKCRLNCLLDRVEAGEDVSITRRGKAVARLAPPKDPFDTERGIRAALRIRQMRSGVTLEGSKIHDLINEGRI